MLQGKAPHREGLELGISSTDATLILAIELREAHCHLAAAGARGGDDDKGTSGLDVVILAKALVGGYQLDIVWIAVNKVVEIGFDAHAFKAVPELVCGPLSVVVGDDHGTDHEAPVLKLVAEAQSVFVVGDAKVGTHLVLLDVFGTNDDDYLYLVAQLPEHAELGVGLEAWQHSRGMVVVEEFATQFEIQFAVELCYALLDMPRLDAQVFLVVKSYFHVW